MFKGMVAERLLIDAREKIRNYHLSIFKGRLTRMDDILFLILTTQNKEKRHSQRLYSVCRQAGKIHEKTVKEFRTDYCWKCDSGPWVCGFAKWNSVTRCLFYLLYAFIDWKWCCWIYFFGCHWCKSEGISLLDSPTLPIIWITLDMRGDFCNIVPDVQGSIIFCWAWIWV